MRARKYTIDTLGTVADVPVDDWVQIGIFEPKEGQKREGETLHLQWHRIRSGEQTIRVELPCKPIFAGIDPKHLLMDLKRADNSSEVDLQYQE